MIAIALQRRKAFSPILAIVAALLAQACGDSGTEPRGGGTPTNLALATPPSSSPRNNFDFATQPVVQLRDGNGRAVRQAGIVITAAITAGGGSLTGRGSLGDTLTITTGTDGTATFTDLRIRGTAGPRTLTFSAPGLSSVTTTVTLAAGEARNIAIHAGNRQTADPGAAVATPPSVLVTDDDGNPVSGVAVTFAVVAGGGAITGANQTTNSSGIATVGSWRLGSTAGTNVLTVTAASLDATRSFIATDPSTGGEVRYHQLLASNAYSCGLANGGVALCWGFNPQGQLGDGTRTNRQTPVAVAGGLTFRSLSAGTHHACGITPAGATYCWGGNLKGTLGDGTTTDRLTPVAVPGAFQSIIALDVFTCGLTMAGTAYCWGLNDVGQLGDGTTTDRSTPVAVAGGLTFRSLMAGGNGAHACGLTTDGRAHCWGLNGHGQVGDGTTINRLTPVQIAGGMTFESLDVGIFQTCGVRVGGDAYCWGRNGEGQLGDGTTTHRSSPTAVAGGYTFQSIAAGGFHTCGLATSGATYCWGYAGAGALGAPPTREWETMPVAVSGGLTFQSISAGVSHTCGLTAGGAAYCWGYNGYGGLGDGTLAARHTPAPVQSP